MMEQTLPILIVDDNPVNQRVLQLLLDYLGVPHKTVSNGLEAVQEVQSCDYAVILMDIMMPVMDGFQATQQIRELEFGAGKHTPIIAVTALSKEDVHKQCLAAGMDDYISKPISKELLSNKLVRWMQMNYIADDYQSDVVGAADEKHPIDRARLRLLYSTDDLEPIFKLFLEITKTLLTELGTAIDRKDTAKLISTAHELKGSSYAVSARQMAKLSLQLEQAGEQDDWSEALKLHAALTLGFLSVQEFLTKPISKKRQDLSQSSQDSSQEP